MSKMRMPEMDAVRFQESDVIVASNVLNLKFYSNKVAGDGEITYKGTTYYTKDGEASFSALFDALGGRETGAKTNLTITSTGVDHAIEDVFYFESGEEQYHTQVITNDGDYIWNGSSWRYRGQ